MRLDAASCSLFFDLPLVKVMRKYFYTDAYIDVGEETLTNLLRKGYVAVPWAEHAQMKFQSECLPEDPLYQLHESSMNGESIENLRRTAERRYQREGRPIPDALSSGPLSNDWHQLFQEIQRADGHQSSEGNLENDPGESQTFLPNS